MFPIFYSLLFSLRVWFRSKVKLQLEIISLRHQLAVTHRQNPKPRLTAADRLFMGLALSKLRQLAICTTHRQTRYCDRMASSGLPLVLDLEDPTWTSGTSEYFKGNSRPDPHHEPGQPDLGCAPNSR